MPLLYYDLLFISFSEEKLLKLWGKSDKRNDKASDESNDAIKCPVNSVLTIIISYGFFFITECLLLRGCWCLVYSLSDMIGYTVTHKPLIYKKEKIIFYRTPTYINANINMARSSTFFNHFPPSLFWSNMRKWLQGGFEHEQPDSRWNFLPHPYFLF